MSAASPATITPFPTDTPVEDRTMYPWIDNEWRRHIARIVGVAALGLYTLLPSYVSWDTPMVAWPTLTAICEDGLLSRPTAIKYLSKLQEHGFLAKVDGYGYQFVMPSQWKNPVADPVFIRRGVAKTSPQNQPMSKDFLLHNGEELEEKATTPVKNLYQPSEKSLPTKRKIFTLLLIESF